MQMGLCTLFIPATDVEHSRACALCSPRSAVSYMRRQDLNLACTGCCIVSLSLTVCWQASHAQMAAGLKEQVSTELASLQESLLQARRAHAALQVGPPVAP